MSILKRGVRFNSQETDAPMQKEEVPLIITNLTAEGLRRAAMAGFHFLQTSGYSLNQAIDLLDVKKETA